MFDGTVVLLAVVKIIGLVVLKAVIVTVEIIFGGILVLEPVLLPSNVRIVEDKELLEIVLLFGIVLLLVGVIVGELGAVDVEFDTAEIVIVEVLPGAVVLATIALGLLWLEELVVEFGYVKGPIVEEIVLEAVMLVMFTIGLLELMVLVVEATTIEVLVFDRILGLLGVVLALLVVGELMIEELVFGTRLEELTIPIVLLMVELCKRLVLEMLEEFEMVEIGVTIEATRTVEVFETTDVLAPDLLELSPLLLRALVIATLEALLKLLDAP